MAVIIEMVHLATLVHDDIIDEADLRRGRPSLAANWGTEVSVLLGDCLFAHALKLAASFPTPEICREVAAATNTVCAGEILQTRSRGNFEVARGHYFKMLAMKTAELFALSCHLGGLLSKAPPPRREALRQYGLALGTAYQLYDDCLDVLGSEAAAGKSLGADLAKGKMTLPVLDRARPRHAGRPASIAAMAAKLGPGPPGRRRGADRKIRRVHRIPVGDPALFVRGAAGAGGVAGVGGAGQAGGIDAFFGGTNRRAWGLCIRTI